MKICDINQCTGCGACAAVCAHQALEMRPDADGYIRPATVAGRCTDCGLCASVCPALHRPQMEEPSKAVALAALDPQQLRASSSGGAASLLSEAFVGAGGVVYACAQHGGMIAHTRIDSADGIAAIRGSKYVQSLLGDAFRRCRDDLRAGREVMFIGTPCQVAGLKAYLRGGSDGLLTVDLVCHGVPSQQLLHDHLHHIGVSGPAHVSFRRKGDGRVKFGLYVSDPHSGAEVYSRDYPADYYISGFLKGIFFRPNCFRCAYACPERVSDLTIGDFWGLGRYAPTAIDAGRGVSLVLVNSERGARHLEAVSGRTQCEERPLREAVEGNEQLQHSFSKPDDYDDFQSAYRRNGYSAACAAHLDAYIRRHRMVMLCERHPLLMLPYRVLAKLVRLF